MHVPDTPNSDLAFACMHGWPEVVGEALHESAAANPINGWDTMIANEAAFIARTRFVRRNMSLAFEEVDTDEEVEVGKADPSDPDYERLLRPAELVQVAKKRRRVLDVHDVPLDRRGEFVEIADSDQASAHLLGFAALLDIRNILVCRDKRKLVLHVPDKLLTAELGRGSHNQFVGDCVERLRGCLGEVTLNGVPEVDSNAFEYFERKMEISTPQAEALGLPKRGRIEPFEAIPVGTLALLGGEVELPYGEYVADYWNGESSAPGKWFGSVLYRVPNPFQ